ncbi:MAG: sugar phosphate isomerase/epimerase [Candidatus Marsarchaeota archaeon]
MKFSVRDNMLAGMKLEDKISTLEQLGYDGIELVGKEELGDKVAKAKELIGSYRIKVSTLSGYRGDLLSPVPSERELALKDLEERLKWSSELGAVGLIVVPTFGGPKLPDLSPLISVRDLEKSLLVAELKKASRVALDNGVRVIIEPLNRYETHLVNTLDEARQIAEDAGEGISIMADLFHMNIEEADPARSIEENYVRLVHVHLADSNRLEPGAGHTDFGRILAVFKNLGYSGYGALECGFSTSPLTALGSALHYLKRYS